MGQATAAQITHMREAAVHVDKAGEILVGLRGHVNRAVNETRGGYDSPAANLFRSIMEQWDVDFGNILSGLSSIGQSLTQTAHNFVDTMDQERSSVNQIAAVLNGNADI